MDAKNLLTVFCTVTTLFLHAQTNYKEGTITKKNGNTINGFINYREWHKNPDRIQFKSELTASDAQTYTADSIAGFSITGYESYTSYMIPVSQDEISFENLKEVIDTSTITKNIFLKEMLTGDRIALFSYTDDIKVRYYAMDKRETIPTELVYRKLLKDGKEFTRPLFKQQLSKLAGDYGLLTKDMDDRISKTTYSGKEIKNIVSRINTLNDNSKSAAIDKKNKLNFFVGAGVSMSTIKYTGENLFTVDGFDAMGRFKYKDNVITHSYLPLIALGGDFYLNPTIRRLILRTEISAVNIKSTVRSHYRFSIYTTEESDYTYRFSEWNIGFRPQVIYNLYNTSKYKWYLGAGISLNYSLGSNNSMERKDSQSGDIVSINDHYIDMQEFNMNAIVRSGIKINEKIDLSLSWDSPIKNTDYTDSKKTVKRSLLSFSVLYNLKN